MWIVRVGTLFSSIFSINVKDVADGMDSDVGSGGGGVGWEVDNDCRNLGVLDHIPRWRRNSGVRHHLLGRYPVQPRLSPDLNQFPAGPLTASLLGEKSARTHRRLLLYWSSY